MNGAVRVFMFGGILCSAAFAFADDAQADAQRATITISGSGSGDATPRSTMMISGSGGGLIIVRDSRTNRRETIDQRSLRLNTPSKNVQERVQAVKDKQLADGDAVLEARKEKQRLAAEAAAQAAEQAQKEAEAAAQAARVKSYKAYEEALTLPPRDRRTGRFRPEPEKPEGYSTDWRNADS